MLQTFSTESTCVVLHGSVVQFRSCVCSVFFINVFVLRTDLLHKDMSVYKLEHLFWVHFWLHIVSDVAPGFVSLHEVWYSKMVNVLLILRQKTVWAELLSSPSCFVLFDNQLQRKVCHFIFAQKVEVTDQSEFYFDNVWCCEVQEVQLVGYDNQVFLVEGHV